MKLTLIQACVGRRTGQKYLKGWQMEPLPLAVIAGLTPPEVEVAFHDDRMEPIPFDEPSDLVAIAVETYTAKRAYQIASEYRRRGVPVVMGGFHATLCPEEVSQYAEAVVIGEAEDLWDKVLKDAERGALLPYYWSVQRPSLVGLKPDRSIYLGKSYLPLALVEATRGCQFGCDFCAIQAFSNSTQNVRPIDEIVAEVDRVKNRPLIFFVDDNFAMNKQYAKGLLRALAPLKIRWVSQTSIDTAHDEELLQLMAASGCQGVLTGLESLNPQNLKSMNKGFNMMKGGFEQALANLRRYKIRLYITFVFGYDEDTEASFEETLQFARKHKFFVAAFNHLVPFPGTPLYKRLEEEGRLLYDKWWLDDDYGFYMVPFQPAHMTPERLERGCIEARAAYYQWGSIWQRGLDPVNRTNPLIWLAYYGINYLMRQEVGLREHYPLGDETWRGELIKVREAPVPLPVSAQAG
jgi:radical SAM superfamily enzyme YgiQ (UPF0313 family)